MTSVLSAMALLLAVSVGLLVTGSAFILFYTLTAWQLAKLAFYTLAPILGLAVICAVLSKLHGVTP